MTAPQFSCAFRDEKGVRFAISCFAVERTPRYGVKVISLVRQAPCWFASVQTVIFALRLCPLGLYPKGGELTVAAPPTTTESIALDTPQPSLFVNLFSVSERDVLAPASLTVNETDRNGAPLLLTILKSTHQTVHVSNFSKDTVKLVTGGDGGDIYCK